MSTEEETAAIIELKERLHQRMKTLLEHTGGGRLLFQRFFPSEFFGEFYENKTLIHCFNPEVMFVYTFHRDSNGTWFCRVDNYSTPIDIFRFTAFVYECSIYKALLILEEIDRAKAVIYRADLPLCSIEELLKEEMPQTLLTRVDEGDYTPLLAVYQRFDLADADLREILQMEADQEKTKQGSIPLPRQDQGDEPEPGLTGPETEADRILARFRHEPEDCLGLLKKHFAPAVEGTADFFMTARQINEFLRQLYGKNWRMENEVRLGRQLNLQGYRRARDVKANVYGYYLARVKDQNAA